MSAPTVEALTAVRLADQAPLPRELRIGIMQAAGAVALLPASPDPRAVRLCHEALRESTRAAVRHLVAEAARQPEATRRELLEALRELSHRIYAEGRS